MNGIGFVGGRRFVIAFDGPILNTCATKSARRIPPNGPCVVCGKRIAPGSLYVPRPTRHLGCRP